MELISGIIAGAVILCVMVGGVIVASRKEY